MAVLRSDDPTGGGAFRAGSFPGWRWSTPGRHPFGGPDTDPGELVAAEERLYDPYTESLAAVKGQPVYASVLPTLLTEAQLQERWAARAGKPYGERAPSETPPGASVEPTPEEPKPRTNKPGRTRTRQRAQGENR
jgi:hypothetical protein